MKVEVIPNKGPASMGAEIDRNLEWARKADIASAFVTTGALKRLRIALEETQKKKRQLKIRLLFGFYQRFTSPQTLSEMLAIQKKYPSRFFVRVARNERFHWKAYLFQKGSDRRFYVGSANLTGDGMTAEGEMSLKVTTKAKDKTAQSLEEAFEKVWQDDTFTLDKSVVMKYEKLARPKEIFTNPKKDEPLSALLRKPKKFAQPSDGKSKPKPRLVYIDGFASEETREIIAEETNWDEKGWSCSDFAYKSQSGLVEKAKIILMVFRHDSKNYELTFERVLDSAVLETPDGKYHIAHARIPYSWSRMYKDVKGEMAAIGLKPNKIKSDKYLTSHQIEELCCLLHVKPEKLLLI